MSLKYPKCARLGMNCEAHFKSKRAIFNHENLWIFLNTTLQTKIVHTAFTTFMKSWQKYCFTFSTSWIFSLTLFARRARFWLWDISRLIWTRDARACFEAHVVALDLWVTCYLSERTRGWVKRGQVDPRKRGTRLMVVSLQTHSLNFSNSTFT